MNTLELEEESRTKMAKKELVQLNASDYARLNYLAINFKNRFVSQAYIPTYGSLEQIVHLLQPTKLRFQKNFQK